MSKLVSELARVAEEVALAVAVSLSPRTVADWRAEPRIPPALVRPVGEPVQALSDLRLQRAVAPSR